MITIALTRLNDIFSDEKKLYDHMKNRTVINGKREYKDKNRWYQTTYPVIIRRYEESRTSPLLECWAEWISWVFSWVAAIPAGGLDEEAMNALSLLEKHFGDVRLESIGLESLMGDIYSANYGETMFVSSNKSDSALIKDFVILADKIIHVNESWNSTLSTTTKLLHFTFPGLFPIYDAKIHTVLFGGKTKSYRHYHAYILALHQFLRTSDLIPLLKVEAQKERVTLVRFVEMLIFSSSKELAKENIGLDRPQV
ncbi:hypothetical protein LJR153_007290 [Paenibacillus sp. LjRoot153]|uniref:hypothetical protein n=1 Tax=Paenibacillus sp. LjRoot153 TaxID=3342270 RepID=UPI003ECD23A4